MIPNTNGATGASEVTIMEVNGTEMQSTVSYLILKSLTKTQFLYISTM